jgi:DNA repair exonuclease SbcCD ATPase subunit
LLETLDVWVIDTGTEQHKGREGLIETFSGGEKTILAEALSLALTQLACRLSGAERPTLIRDESAGQLSEGNAPIWMAMLRRAADIINVDRILFVNHDRQTWDLADARINVGGA